MSEPQPPQFDKYANFFEGNNWRLPSDPEIVGSAREALAKKLTGWDEQDEIVTGFGEALKNAIEHGNLGFTKNRKEHPDITHEQILDRFKNQVVPKFVTVEISITNTEVRISIEDEGRGFDYESIIKEIDSDREKTEEEKLVTSGMGILIMRKLYFDEVNYSNGGRKVELIKRRQV